MLRWFVPSSFRKIHLFEGQSSFRRDKDLLVHSPNSPYSQAWNSTQVSQVGGRETQVLVHRPAVSQGAHWQGAKWEVEVGPSHRLWASHAVAELAEPQGTP